MESCAQLLTDEIAAIRAKPLYYGFVVCNSFDFSPVYEDNSGYKLTGDSLAIFDLAQARKIAGKFNKKADLGNFRPMIYEQWAPVRINTLQLALDKLATLD